MSEENRPRYKEQIDIGPDFDMDVSGAGAHDSGRSKSNRGSGSRKSKRNGRAEAWMKK